MCTRYSTFAAHNRRNNRIEWLATKHTKQQLHNCAGAFCGGEIFSDFQFTANHHGCYWYLLKFWTLFWPLKMFSQFLLFNEIPLSWRFICTNYEPIVVCGFGGNEPFPKGLSSPYWMANITNYSKRIFFCLQNQKHFLPKMFVLARTRCNQIYKLVTVFVCLLIWLVIICVQTISMRLRNISYWFVGFLHLNYFNGKWICWFFDSHQPNGTHLECVAFEQWKCSRIGQCYELKG